MKKVFLISLCMLGCSSSEKRIAKTVLDIAAAVCPETDTVRQCAKRIMDSIPEKDANDGGKP